jgi:hypothetical protein|tara:strand:+ start:504 stop:818 length:315 start_codon:yes stop_codon:yes gene_type:complete
MGRDDKGRFAEGNSGGPGRPRRAIERDYLRTLAEACPLETWEVIVVKAVKEAVEGDEKARAWLSKYLLGNGTLYQSLTSREKDDLLLNNGSPVNLLRQLKEEMG